MPAGITSKDSMFSVREVPWHKLGIVLDKPPKSVDDALDKSGLGWVVVQRQVEVITTPEWIDDHGRKHKEERVAAVGYKANVRSDTGDILGIVTDEYQLVTNRDAFRFLDAIINSDVHWETAGSLHGGKRVWVLVRLPEWMEVAGDVIGQYLWVANSYDGSMAVTASVTDIRVVCQNTWNMAISRGERNVARTFKFRHTGNLTQKYEEARKVLGLALNFNKQFKVLGDQLGRQKITENTLDRKVLRELFKVEPDMGKIAVANREKAREQIMLTFNGHGPRGDTTGNAPGTKWCAVNAIGEFADWGRRTTSKTSQIARSFEDVDLKQRGLDLVLAA